ncbi:ROK family transcriptional regulator [Streptomyces sp. NPDC049954]|uniref:ROK family transcriptional regulator n=1 Tax=Streptomyces sp. NPDC049954 TaxID=3155779 RepID=UPI00342C2F22
MRGHNTALVLDLLRAAGTDGISRPELAARTGLTPQAVSKIAARLRQGGLVADAGRRASTGGKPATALRLVPGAAHALGVHLDRDELRTVRTDLAGTVLAAHRAPLDLAAGAEAVVETVAEGVVAVAESGEACAGPSPRPAHGGEPRASTGPLLGAGVVLPGPLDHERGVLHRVSGQPGWDGYPLRAVLAERLGLPVVLDKDTNAAALGPAVAGAARSFAYLHLGTGLGAGLVLDGVLHRGARTGAGEFGHQVLDLDGPPCVCGDRGCVEALCLAALRAGDVAEAARVLGVAAANLVGLLDIDLVLLGGRRIAREPGPFLEGVADVLAARARRTGDAGPVPVRRAPGADTAIAEGAAQLVLAPVFGRVP